MIAFVALSATGLSAQEPPLRPLADYLTAADEIPASDVPYVTRRCSALFSLIAEERERRGDPGTAEMYRNWSIGFEVAAVAANIEGGTTTLEELRNNENAIEQIASRLRERTDRTVYIADDLLLSSDVRTCRDLVDELDL